MELLGYHEKMSINTKRSWLTPRDLGRMRDNCEIARKKQDKNISDIISLIDTKKTCHVKRYQLSGYNEWKKLEKLLALRNDITYSLEIDPLLTRNKVSKITSHDSRDFLDGDDYDKMCSYEHVKVPVIYVKIKHKLC